MSRNTKIISIIFLVAVLILIRGFEESLFYDPLTQFFKSVRSYDQLPEFESLKLLSNVVLRFLLNTIVSFGVLWVIFENREVIKISALLYSVLFILLFIVFSYLLFSRHAATGIVVNVSINFMSLFYVRRFLIHPIILLVLAPAFYYQNKK
jgi:exosortase F-associated protein